MISGRLLLLISVIGFLISPVVFGQTVEITGQIIAKGDVENIHVINRTSNHFTTTNAKGYFRITATYKDTLQFTSVRYKTTTRVVSYSIIQDRNITVYLEENVNVLDEVIVGKVLTGKLDSDIENTDAERPIDFYDLGLPGYKGPLPTQSERRLAEATKVQPGLIPILPLINAISGRTKTLKEHVRLERLAALLQSIKDRLSNDFFETYPIAEDHRQEFLYFCSEDADFDRRCYNRSDIEVFEFLAEKYEDYQLNLQSSRD
ncbi:MAG: hypothetical protein HKN00_00270 [Flavobacteriaceae bacterium]|nr:carboxypeptidase-like regulatory domain-containing protein [Bacteroidia bacterium]NNF73589.1 hypothetical protein [Flavobacteriaceae bacterium]NNK73149.1 hypothetical protein [Flavobacteriaceae bacterium]